MTMPDPVSKLLSLLESSGFEAFVVGGCVRDSLLGLQPHDWDICTAAHPEEMQKLFQDFSVIPTGLQHGTVTVLVDKHPIEVTTFRSDGIYCDNRHPETVTFLPSVEGDLSRRDFTINAMAYSPKTGLIDLFAGKKDLEDRILRCVGNPVIRFEEDALRIMRALRFSAAYHLEVEPQTAKAIHGTKNRLLSIARERIWSELKKLLEAETPGKLLMNYLDIIETIIFLDLPHNTISENNWNTSMSILDNLPVIPAVRLAELLYALCTGQHFQSADDFHIYCTQVLRNLKLDNHTRGRTLRLLRMQKTPLPSTLPLARQMTGQIGRDGFKDFLAWKTAHAQAAEKSAAQAADLKKAREYQGLIAEKNLCCSVGELAVNGNDLIAAGMEPGAYIGQTLTDLLALVLNEELPNEKKALLHHLFS